MTATLQYGFRRYAEVEQVRREIVETDLLQLQNSAESLYFRASNLRDRSGRSVMSDDYYRLTSAYVLGRILAYEALLVSKGVYAKLHRNNALKYRVKATLHALNQAMDDQTFLHYHRLQLADMLLDGQRVISYTEFLHRWSDRKFADANAAVALFVETVSDSRLDRIRDSAAELVKLLAAQTRVPSAMELAIRKN